MIMAKIERTERSQASRISPAAMCLLSVRAHLVLEHMASCVLPRCCSRFHKVWKR